MSAPIVAVDVTGETSSGLLEVPVARRKTFSLIQMLEVFDFYRCLYLTSTCAAGGKDVQYFSVKTVLTVGTRFPIEGDGHTTW